MSGSNYIKLFDATIMHSYFENSTCTCLKFIEDYNTAKLIKRYQLLVQYLPNGISLYYNGTSTIKDFFQYIQHTTGQNAFVFNFISTDTNFLRFTECPTNFLFSIVLSTQPAEKTLNINYSPTESSNTLGSLRINFEDIVNQINKYNSVNFTGHFFARATQWDYYIINKSGLSENNLFIKGKNNIAFSGPEKTTIPTGENALLFSSNTAIPFSKFASLKFDLFSTSGESNFPTSQGNGKIIFKGLPNPDPGKLQHKTFNNGPTLVSPLYVYI